MDYHFAPPVRILSLVVLLLPACISGCSEFDAQKISLKTEAKAISGIPFTLTRPEFTLTRAAPAEGAKEPTYTLTVAYEPDPQQSYTLQFDPGLFVDPTFGLKFGPGSTLSSTNATATDQIGPTVVAISSFTASLLGSIAKAAFDADSVRNEIQRAISQVIDSKNPACTSLLLDSIKRQMNTFADDKAFSNQFHYLTEAERTCLEAAQQAIREESGKSAAENEKAFKDEVANHLTAFPDDKPWISKVLHAQDDGDRSALNALTPGSGETDDKSSSRRDVIAAALDAAGSKVQLNAVKTLQVIIDLSPEAWRARHVLYLEREINARNREMLMTPGSHAKQRAEIASLQQERMLTLSTPAVSATRLYKRQLLLEDFVEKIEKRSFENGGTAPAMAEYATARAELDEIRKQIDALRSSVVEAGKAAAPPAVPPLPATRVKLVSSDFVTKSPVTAEDPDYVVVLEEIQ